MRRMIPILLFAVSCLAAPAASAQQQYPVKPIRLIVPYTAGGGIDFVGRPIMQKLSERLGRSIIFDNRPGGGATIGTAAAARAEPDGYTLLITLSQFTIASAIMPNAPYDPIKDFHPISQLMSSSLVLVVHPSVPATSVRELILLAKAKPGEINYGSNGPGNNNHLGMELLKRMAGIDMVHVPYKGGGPAQTALLSGEISVMFLPASFGVETIKAGKARALAVSTSTRNVALPGVPTVAEAGVPGFEVDGWWGLFAPQGTPRAIIDRLQHDLSQVMHEPKMKAFLAARGAVPVGSTPEQFAAFVARDLAKWKKLVMEAGLQVNQ
ncbi:MAG: tripartite tricarboxylate transporter substrate binding protein [Burkholderiales bacterium]|nr:tripartite tricarboxylate transporter substrate binding protein [Burkholderiales bacterium]